MSVVASNVYRIIQDKCLKQSAVAVKAGYGAKKFNAMLKGRKIITSEDILPIANALNVVPGELFKSITEEEE